MSGTFISAVCTDYMALTFTSFFFLICRDAFWRTEESLEKTTNANVHNYYIL